MKVCFLTSNYPPEAVGGTEQVVKALARELRALGIGVVVVTSSDVVHAGTDVGEEEFEGVQVRRLYRKVGEFDHNGHRRPRLLDLLGSSLEDLRPDVVHVHSFAALGTGSLALCRHLGIPVALTFHDLWATCARYFRLPRPGITCPTGIDRAPCAHCIDRDLGIGPEAVAAVLAERDSAVRADVELAAACTAPSRTAANFVRQCLPYDGPIEVIPHGLLRSVPGEHRARLHPRMISRVGTFGNLVPEKGIRELVEALAGLPCLLVLAGPFLDPKFGSEIIRAANEAGIGPVASDRYGPDDVHPARCMGLAVFPSKCEETYGLVVDEALAHGVPCVLSDRGAFAERAGHPGVVVTPLEKLRDVLHDLVTHPERIDALRAAIPKELPTIATAAERYLELYRSLA